MSRGHVPRAVFDCNVIIQAMALAATASECLRLVESGRVHLFLSRASVSEIRRVARYPKIVSISPQFTDALVAAFLRKLLYRATFLRTVPHVFNFDRDPDDEAWIDLAIAARAQFLVTRDRDLLSLMTGNSATCKQFRRKAVGMRVLAPSAFLNVDRGTAAP